MAKPLVVASPLGFIQQSVGSLARQVDVLVALLHEG